MTIKNKILTSTTQTPRQQTNKQTNKTDKNKKQNRKKVIISLLILIGSKSFFKVL